MLLQVLLLLFHSVIIADELYLNISNYKLFIFYLNERFVLSKIEAGSERTEMSQLPRTI